MSDVSQGPGWWQASDGKWYPPKESEQPPAPGWWLAANGKWYPPVEGDHPPQAGWWLAADGKWYPPAETAAVVTAPPVFEPTPIEIDQLPAAPTPPAPVTPPVPVPVPVAAPELAPEPPVPADQRPPRSVEQASSRAAAQYPRPTDSDDQIRQRDAASRQDAIAQAPARFMAASRALRLLAEADESETTAPRAPEPAPEPRATAAARSAVQDTLTEATSTASRPPVGPAAPSAPPRGPARPATSAPDPPSNPPEIPLIELRTSPLGAEIDHLGDRLLVFADRVERRDRTDRVRQTLRGDDIVDVVIQRKFTGAVLSVESASETIVTRGIKPEQADQARALIHRQTRNGRPPQPRDSTVSPDVAPSTVPDVVPSAQLSIGNRQRINEADLLRKLADLHRAGVLSDSEFEAKIALVGRLVSGESIAIS